MLASDGVPVLRDHFNDTRQILDRPPCHRDKLCPYSVSAMPKFDTDMVCRGHNPTPANAMPSTCAENQHNARLYNGFLRLLLHLLQLLRGRALLIASLVFHSSSFHHWTASRTTAWVVQRLVLRWKLTPNAASDRG
jgi:hypothetical protein